MAEHESHAPQEATAQVATAGARHSSERRSSEDSVEQRHRKILVFAHVGRKEARDAARPITHHSIVHSLTIGIKDKIKDLIRLQ